MADNPPFRSPVFTWWQDQDIEIQSLTGIAAPVKVDTPPPRSLVFTHWQDQDTEIQLGGAGTPSTSQATQTIPTPWLASIILAWQPPDPPPTLPRNLAPAIPGQSVDRPPFVHPERTRVQSQASAIAWQPPDPSPFVGGRQPLEPARLSPGIPGQSVDRPPFVHQQRTKSQAQAIAAITQPDLWTYTFIARQGRLQPYGPGYSNPSDLKVPEPPHAHPQRQIAQAALETAIAQPDPWTYSFEGGLQPFAPRKANPSDLKVPEPPHAHPQRQIVQQSLEAGIAQPDPWAFTFVGGSQPYAPRPVNPVIEAVVVNNPPFVPEGRDDNVHPGQIILMWQEPNPYTGWTYTFMGGAQPFAPARLPPQLTAVRVDSPPLNADEDVNLAVIQLWQPDPWGYLFVARHGSNLQPYGPGPVSPGIPGRSVDKPALNADEDVNLSVVIQAWQPPDPWPVQRGKLSPSIPGQSVDNPPPFRPFQPILLPPDPQPILIGKLAPGIPGQSVDNPPRQRAPQPGHGPSWLPPDLIPILAGKLAAGIPGVSVDNPIFTHRERTPLQLQASVSVSHPDPWTYSFLGGKQPYDWAKLSPGIPGQSVDNPPGRGSVQAFVLPPDLVPTLPGKLSPGLMAVTVTIIGLPPAWLPTVLAIWQPADPQPSLARNLSPQLTAVQVDNPPFSSRDNLSRVIQAWQEPWYSRLAQISVAAIAGVPVVSTAIEWIIRARRRARR